MQEASGDAQGVSTGEGDVPSRNRIGLENALSPSFGSETAVPTTASGKAKESADSLGVRELFTDAEFLNYRLVALGVVLL